VGSYSDIFVVSAAVLPRFCHYCGVFAATNLHAELAIPSAMVLTAEDLVSEKELEEAGKALWTEEHFEILKPFGSIQNLLLANMDYEAYARAIVIKDVSTVFYVQKQFL
jgi:hypothetical protein